MGRWTVFLYTLLKGSAKSFNLPIYGHTLSWPSCFSHIYPLTVFLQMLPSDPEVILCNNTKMLREHLSISGDRRVEEHQEQDSDYVYDLYYQETVTPGWIQDILFVRAYADEGELVCVNGWLDSWMIADIGVSDWRNGWRRKETWGMQGCFNIYTDKQAVSWIAAELQYTVSQSLYCRAAQ